MTWAQEILRTVLLAFGTTEIITNSTYLIKQNGLYLARKQHGELPKNVSDEKIRLKVVCMLLFGMAFFGTALSTYIFHKYIHNAIVITSMAFSLYGIIEALYYKYWKTFGFGFVTILLAICSIII